MRPFSNLSKVVYKRTYSRNDNGVSENFADTVERIIRGNVEGHQVSAEEINRLRYFISERKAGPAGRGWWCSGSPAQKRFGGAALTNCWFVTASDWHNFVIAQDLLMLGGGVGLSVERQFTDRLPRIKKNVKVIHRPTKDADFIVPDSREGWCELLRRTLESFFVSGKSFSYSTVCIRPFGEPISGFGGTASGPKPLINMIEKICDVISSREGSKLRPIDAADVLCCVGEMVVAGNVRRSAIIILGDAHDRDYLKAKRWDLGPVPTQRAMANFSIVAEDAENDLRPLFWETYKHGEAFGIVNRYAIQHFGRGIANPMRDSAIGTNPCVPAGTEILTDSGYFSIDSLVGHTVNVWNGFEFSPVQPQITGKNQPLVKVKLSSGQDLTCTPTHRFLVQDSYAAQPRLVAASDLSKGCKLAKTGYPVLKHGESIDTRQAYTQGFYSGDGSTGHSGMSLYGENKIACAKYMFGKLGSYDQKQDRTYFRLGFNPLPKDFVPMGWSLEAKLGWLAGLLDSDGVILKEGGSQISSVDRQFLCSVQKMLTTMGTSSKLVPMFKEGVKNLPDGRGGKKEYLCQASYRLLIGAVQMQNLVGLGITTHRIAFSHSPNRDASRFNTVVSVEPAGMADTVYCFKDGKRGLGCFEGIVTGNCAEATLEEGEPCNLQEINLAAIESVDEFAEAARLMHRYGKRVTMEKYHWAISDEVIKRNRRIGTGITGCLQNNNLFNANVLDHVYSEIQKENKEYAKFLGIPESIRTTVIKPSGSQSKLLEAAAEGIHPAYSRYVIQRIRIASNDPLITRLQTAGHYMEPVERFDGTLDPQTMVVDFYLQTPEGCPIADEGFGTKEQLDALLLAQEHWADQAVSITVYYKEEDLQFIKDWVHTNLHRIKTISFLKHTGHGFKQAPKEAITKEQYEKLSSTIKPLDIEDVGEGELVSGLECDGGACPIR